MNIHQENIKLYLSLGGDSRKAKQITASTLQNRAKLAHLLGQLQTKPDNLGQSVSKERKYEPNPEPVDEPAPVRKKGVFSDFISQYPVELHETYKKRYEHWLEACSLKVSLNEIPEEDSEAALIIQDKIMKCFSRFDACQEALDYFNEKKRVLPVKSSQDFSQLTPVELLKIRNNLRSQITKRKATIKKKQTELPNAGPDNFKLKHNALNRKIEELRELELQLKEVESLLT